ncbi:MAG: geranylgeranyl pyrophosphate synthase [Solibacillus sp.]|uniref:geranylgeranyl pyrophosphate synthase n=1 Tax=unclassified Solibacillus TaxID=2637870 RepID=UPI0030F689D5
MNNQIQLNLPEWFVLDELHIIETIISKNSADVGIVIAGENLDDSKRCCPTVRLYMIRLVEEQYELIKELDAFQFETIEEAKTFSKKLPELNAIDLVMMVNKEQSIFTV